MIKVLDLRNYGQNSVEFLKYWSALKTDNAIPNWDRFDVLQITRWLGYVNAVSVIDAGVDFEFRVYGTSLTVPLFSDYTGKAISEIQPKERADKSLEFYRKIVETARPHCTFHDTSEFEEVANPVDRRRRYWLRLAVPFSTDDKTVDRLLGYAVSVPTEHFEQEIGENNISTSEIYPLRLEFND